ncbi:MAG TPA: helix-turn-helix transcriptional regulator [Dehalococcoidia bacterium]|nr:helix-turn-helix transcriptional regulator [Dehalococcoidia bacterium]
MKTHSDLSPRDLDVARLAASGLTGRDIADRLLITMNTVKYHLKRVYKALGVHNRAQLVNALQNHENYPNG